jgi:RHS repeat-associated protein
MGQLHVADATGTTTANESFTPYGNRREASTWSGSTTSTELSAMNGVTREGYTFQTVLGSMGLNHMNGRIEDAIIGRFLSPDPHGIHKRNTQSLNRYSYVSNNPLTFVDPTGFEEDDEGDLNGGGGSSGGGYEGGGSSGGDDDLSEITPSVQKVDYVDSDENPIAGSGNSPSATIGNPFSRVYAGRA